EANATIRPAAGSVSAFLPSSTASIGTGTRTDRCGNNEENQSMRDYRFDHVHLRSANPSAIADFFETMFAAEVTRDVYPVGTLYPGQQRIRMRVGGQTVLIAPAHPHDATGAAPTFPYYGLEHMGLTVDNVDAACAELKAK